MFAFSSDATIHCPTGCMYDSVRTPNNLPGADALANHIGHEIVETLSDPMFNAWENPDKGNYEVKFPSLFCYRFISILSFRFLDTHEPTPLPQSRKTPTSVLGSLARLPCSLMAPFSTLSLEARIIYYSYSGTRSRTNAHSQHRHDGQAGSERE